MPAPLGHWAKVALATFLCCIAVYETATHGLGELSTWLYVAAAALMVFVVAWEAGRIWRGKERTNHDDKK